MVRPNGFLTTTWLLLSQDLRTVSVSAFMFTRKQLVSIGWLLLAILLFVGIVAYRFMNLPSSTLSAETPMVNPPAPASAFSPFDPAIVEKYLTVEAALLGADDHASVYMKDEGADKDVSINAVRSWIPASTIKSFVVIEAFRQRDAGRINFDSTVTIQAQNVVPTELETDEFPRLREGTQITIGQLVGAMIIQSDNTAYNTLLDILDRRMVNATLRTLGITQTVVGEKLNVDDTQFQADLQEPGRQPNTVTAKDLATLFDLLYRGKITHSDEILAIFKRQKINTMIPALLPSDVIVAHKTGDWAPIYHDGGVVYKPNDPFVLSIFTDTNDPNILAQLARVAYYRTSQVVGQGVQGSPKPHTEDTSRTERIYLADVPQVSNVLGVATDAVLGEHIYTVEPGDTLWSIAAALYGSGYVYPTIISRNNISDPGNISPGMKLYLPPIPGTTFVPTIQNPALTASDFGISANDFKISHGQTRTIGVALILPGSPLYALKAWWLNQAVNRAPTNDAKIDALLAISASKLAEIKSELALGNVNAIQSLLTQSEEALRQATNLAKSSTNNDVALFKIKQERDVHFGVLAEAVPRVSSFQKDAYVTAVYAFYTKQKQDVQPAVASLHPANPLEQQPVVGTVSDIKNNIATVRREDGKTVQVLLIPLTPARAYDQKVAENATSVRVGERVAVVGTVTPESIVTPQFILRNIPKQLPLGRRGTVLEIHPNDHTITLQDTQGKIDTIVVGEATTIKSKDTDVSIAGIKAGSVITVVGSVVSPGATATPVKTSIPAPSGSPGPSGSPTPAGQGKAKSSEGRRPQSGGETIPAQQEKTEQTTTISTTTVAPSTAGQTVQANTVTVEKNASGKHEKVSSSPAPAKQSGENKNKSAPPPPAVLQEKQKREEKKK